MPTAAAAGAVVGVAGAVAGGAGQAIAATQGGGSGQPLQFTPEQTLAMLDFMDGALNDLTTIQDSLTTAQNYTDERLSAVQDYMQGTLPASDFMKTLTKNAQEIAAAFGGDAKAAIEAGFIDETTARMSGLIEDREGQVWNTNQAELDSLREMEKTGFKDPRLEAQLQDQRKTLEQSLARSGVSPAQRAIALQQFESSAEQQRFTRSEELKTGSTERAMARIGATGSMLSAGVSSMQTAANVFLAGKQQRLAEATTGGQAVMQMLQYGQSTAGNIAQIMQARLQNTMSTVERQMAISAQGQNIWQQIGQTQMPNKIKDLMKSGTVGPGSLYEQTGISTNQTRQYAQSINQQETDVNKGKVVPGDINRNPNSVLSQTKEGGYGLTDYQGAPGQGSAYVPPAVSTNRAGLNAPVAPGKAEPLA